MAFARTLRTAPRLLLRQRHALPARATLAPARPALAGLRCGFATVPKPLPNAPAGTTIEQPVYTREEAHENLADLITHVAQREDRMMFYPRYFPLGWRMIKFSRNFLHGQAMASNARLQSRRLEFEALDLSLADFYTSMALYSLHVWMARRRLLIEGDGALEAEARMFDAMWDHMTQVMVEECGVVSILLNKRLVEMQGIMFSAMNHFDLGLQNAEGHDLESSLQKYVFTKTKATPAQISALADYVRGELAALTEFDALEFMQGKFVWADPPANLRYSRANLPDRTQLLGEWRVAYAGRMPYFWNTLTRETRWEKPLGVKIKTEVDV